jgi:hypothetical protein
LYRLEALAFVPAGEALSDRPGTNVTATTLLVFALPFLMLRFGLLVTTSDGKFWCISEGLDLALTCP